MQRITIDPITRLEGHGKIEIFLNEEGDVANTYFQIPELRGFERFCVGRPVEEMLLLTEDYADTDADIDSETEVNKDMISFVAIVEPRIEDYYIAIEEQSETLLDEEEEDNPLPSDLARIVYYIGASPEDETVQSLMRIQTSNLDTEELQEMLEELLSGTLSEEEQEGLQSSVLVDHVGGLNLRYFDGEEWIDVWDMEEEEGLPNGVEITLTITDADTGEKTLTEAVVVYLPLSEPPGDEMATGMGEMGL